MSRVKNAADASGQALPSLRLRRSVDAWASFAEHHIPRGCSTKEISEPELRRSLKRVGHRDFPRPIRPIANRPKEVGTLLSISRKQAESLSRTEYLA
jgi:hypothetical protein